MELDREIINLDAIKGTCIIGKIERTEQGTITKNKTFCLIQRSAIQYALRSLGRLATISFEENSTNIIYNVKALNSNSYQSHNESLELANFTLNEVNLMNRTVKLSVDDSKNIYVKAYCSSTVLRNSLELIGEKVNFVLSTKDIKKSDRNKNIIAISNYQVLGNQSNDSSIII